MAALIAALVSLLPSIIPLITAILAAFSHPKTRDEFLAEIKKLQPIVDSALTASNKATSINWNQAFKQIEAAPGSPSTPIDPATVLAFLKLIVSDVEMLAPGLTKLVDDVIAQFHSNTPIPNPNPVIPPAPPIGPTPGNVPVLGSSSASVAN